MLVGEIGADPADAGAGLQVGGVHVHVHGRDGPAQGWGARVAGGPVEHGAEDVGAFLTAGEVITATGFCECTRNSLAFNQCN